jgi:predicted metal-dependent hydrolase
MSLPEGPPRRPLHPELSPVERAALLRTGVERFNRGEFFSAHEAWEEIWRSTTPEPRELFQGLVQAAAAFHHLARQRPDVSGRVLAKARRRLAPLGERAAGIDLGAFRAALEEWAGYLRDPSGPPPDLPRLELASDSPRASF